MVIFSLLRTFFLYLCRPAYLDDVSISSESVSSIRKPDLELARYLEYARVNWQLGRKSRSEIVAEISAIVNAPSEDDGYLGTALDHESYQKLLSKCRLRIEARDRREAFRIQRKLYVPKGHVMHSVWRKLFVSILRMK